jgi:hypothetical protein
MQTNGKAYLYIKFRNTGSAEERATFFDGLDNFAQGLCHCLVRKDATRCILLVLGRKKR